MLFVPNGPDFSFQYGGLSVGPNNNGVGTNLNSAGVGSYGAYTTVVSAGNVTEDCYGIYINLNTIASRTSMPLLATVGIDPAGGTSFTDIIKDVSGAQATANLYDIGGHGYYFPVFIPAGSTIGIKTAGRTGISSSSAQIFGFVQLFGAPRSPEAVKVGQNVQSYGTDLTNAMGVTVSLANNTTGAWVELGTVGSDEYPFFWDVSLCANSSNLPQSSFNVDLAIGDASNKKIVIQGKRVLAFTSEALSSFNPCQMGGYMQAAPGDKIYGRTVGPSVGSWSGTFSLIAHGVM